jgi:hypothetical protein
MSTKNDVILEVIDEALKPRQPYGYSIRERAQRQTADDIRDAAKELNFAVFADKADALTTARILAWIDAKFSDTFGTDAMVKYAGASEGTQARRNNAFNALKVNYQRTERLLTSLCSVLPPNQSVYTKLNEQIPKQYTADDLRKLKDCEDRLAKARAVVVANAYTARSAAYDEQMKRAEKEIAAGKTATIRTRAEVDAEAQANMRLAKELQRKIFDEAKPTIQKITRATAAAYLEVADNIEFSERAECEKFGVPFRMSDLPLTVRSAAFALCRDIPSRHTGAAILSFLSNILNPKDLKQ